MGSRLVNPQLSSIGVFAGGAEKMRRRDMVSPIKIAKVKAQTPDGDNVHGNASFVGFIIFAIPDTQECATGTCPVAPTSEMQWLL
jgi:hypothetical protein